MAWPITRDLMAAVRELFPVRRDRWVIVGLVALAALVSITELAAAQLFSVIIDPESQRDGSARAVLVVAFLVVFSGLRLVNYAREMYRLTVFDRALHKSVGSQVSDSWRWAMAMELTTLLSTASRITIVVIATIVIADLFGVAVLVAVGIVGMLVSLIYRRQRDSQRGFRAAQLAYQQVPNATKVRTRVRAGELGSLVAHLFVVVLIGLLLAMILDGSIEANRGLVMFIALRMLGQTLTEFSKGLMRFVRARAFSEKPPVERKDLEEEDG